MPARGPVLMDEALARVKDCKLATPGCVPTPHTHDSTSLSASFTLQIRVDKRRKAEEHTTKEFEQKTQPPSRRHNCGVTVGHITAHRAIEEVVKDRCRVVHQHRVR